MSNPSRAEKRYHNELAESEIWRDVPGYGGFYQASSLGRVRAKERVVEKWHKSGQTIRQTYVSRVLNPRVDGKGYYRIHAGIGGKKYHLSVHRLVLLAFFGQPDDGQECCHRNGVSADNRPGNLRWDTHHANNGDRIKHGTYSKGGEHPMSKFSLDTVRGIRSGEISRRDAITCCGVSSSQFHRIKKDISWAGL